MDQHLRYVRLHQPHPFFTAGNIEWTLGKERAHLVTKDEGVLVWWQSNLADS